jgi:hypothetical protein
LEKVVKDMANKEAAKTNQKRKADEAKTTDLRKSSIKYKPSTTKSAEHP